MDTLLPVMGGPNMFGLVEGDQNRIEPGKRPLSSMPPTIVLDRDGGVPLVVGGAGGPMIPTGTKQLILNVIEYRMTWVDAMHAPRIHHQAWPATLFYQQDAFALAVADSLRAMGHHLVPQPVLMVLNGIMRVRGGWHGLTQPFPPGFPLMEAAAVGF